MYRAIKTFAGIKIAMKKGDTKNFIEKEIAEDLLRAGYIEEIPDEISIKVESIKLYGDRQVVAEIEEKVEEAKKEEVVEEIKEVEKPKRTTTRKKK